MQAHLVGLGAVGTRVARELLADPSVELSAAEPEDRAGLAALVAAVGSRMSVGRQHPTVVPAGTDVVVVARPSGAVALAAAALAAGAHVVAVVDDPDEVVALLELDPLARAAGLTVAVGVALAPGVSCLLARLGASRLDEVGEIHVASHGTGGPACARRHHAALTAVGTDWYDGEWRRRPGGSGRELVWFPEPVGAADCYRADLPDAPLLVPAFPGVRRVTARLEATRRDRLTSPLPMLRRPHPEGTVGAVRVEVRGRRAGTADSVVLGTSGRPALVAGTLAALVAGEAVGGRLRAGAGGLASLVDRPGPLLAGLVRRGIWVGEFAGSPV